MLSSRACTVSSVSISNPEVRTGKDLTNRRAAQHAVAESMSGAVCGPVPGGAGPGDHVEASVDQAPDHLGSRTGVVGIVAVDQHVDVRFDVREHPPDDVALAQQGLPPDPRPRLLGHLCGPVGGRVVVDPHDGAGQGRAEVLDHLGDGRLFVEARDQDGDVESPRR
jgi:hypothetical protein